MSDIAVILGAVMIAVNAFLLVESSRVVWLDSRNAHQRQLGQAHAGPVQWCMLQF
jgi:hypothetical protein